MVCRITGKGTDEISCALHVHPEIWHIMRHVRDVNLRRLNKLEAYAWSIVNHPPKPPMRGGPPGMGKRFPPLVRAGK